MTYEPDVRRWAAFQAFGRMRILEGVQGALEDVEGALSNRQMGVAAMQARVVILLCLSIRSLSRGGELLFDSESLSFDWFENLEDPEIEDALALVREVSVLVEPSVTYVERLRAYVAQTEALLGAEAQMPLLRSPSGPFALVAVARTWGPILADFGLPTVLPGDWLNAQRQPP